MMIKAIMHPFTNLQPIGKNMCFKYYKSIIVPTVFDIPGRHCIDHR